MASYSENRIFWEQLFTVNDLANQLLTLSRDFGDCGIEIIHPKFGAAIVKAKPASALGDNFFSDTFIVDAEAKTDKRHFTAFTKVSTCCLISVVPFKLGVITTLSTRFYRRMP